MATDIFTGVVKPDTFRKLSVMLSDRFKRDIKRLPQHLHDSPQPITHAGAWYGPGPVYEYSFALSKDGNLRNFPNYIYRQPAVYSALRTRVRSVASREWGLKPWDADNEADEALAEFVQKQIEGIGTHPDLAHRNTIDDVREMVLKELCFYGSAFAGVRWDQTMRSVVELDRVPRTAMDYFQGDPKGKTTEEQRSGWRWYDRMCLSPRFVQAGQMIIVVNGGSRSSPWGEGVLDALYWLSFFSGVVLPMWGKWLERHATPWVVGKSENTTDLGSLQNILDASFDNPNLTVPPGTTIEFIQPGTAAHSVYQGFTVWANEQFREVILGTSLTTASPQPHGSYALANIHQDSTEEILQGDAKVLDNALTWTLCYWLAQVHGPRFGAVTRLDSGAIAPPYFATSMDRVKDVNVVAQTLQVANQYVDLPKALIYELLPDIRPPKDGEEVIPAQSAQQQPPGGGAAPEGMGGLAALLGGAGAPPGAQAGHEQAGHGQAAPARFAESSLGEVADREFAEIEKLMASATTRVRDAKKNSCPTREPALSATGAPWREVIP